MLWATKVAKILPVYTGKAKLDLIGEPWYNMPRPTMPQSSRGLGHSPFKAATGIRIPVGAPLKRFEQSKRFLFCLRHRRKDRKSFICHLALQLFTQVICSAT